MDNGKNINSSDYTDDEIRLREIFSILWQGKWLVVATTSFFLLVAIVYSLYLPNIYQSKALLSPADDQDGLDQALGNYSGLANLAGISLPNQSSANNTVEALEKLNSLSFFTDNILPNIFLPDLMAIKSWDAMTNTTVYNKDDFNEGDLTWVRDFKFPQTQIPSAQESFEIFKNKHLEVSEDRETGFITIAVKHQSPFVAQAWIELIVRELNYFFLTKDKAQAQAAMDYLNAQIAQTSFAEIKQVTAQLLQQKIQELTLIEVSDFYVFDYIDPPAVMERKYEPKRWLITILGGLLGGMLGILITLFRRYYMDKKL